MASSAMVYNAYPTWTATHEVYAFVFWDVVLTLSEIQKVHDYYRNKIGAANMAVWQG
jgi:zona occludens toxin (predicted ATPase)